MTRLVAKYIAVASLASTVLSDPQSFCADSNNEVCFQVAVPESSASAGSGNIYFQLTAPESYQWVGLGTGTRMANANFFIMYADGSGNVTISARQASGQVMPTTSSDGADLTLLAGSGVNNGVMTANVLCTNCESWKSQTMQLDSTDSPWLAAWRTGDAIDSTNVNAGIQEHNSDPQMLTVDLQQASVTDDSNPFLGASSNPSSGGNGNSGSGGNGGDSGGVSISGSGSDDSGPSDTIILAHGVIFTLVFVVLYPLGAILMPLLGKWLIHASWQMITFLLMWAGFALGVVYAREDGSLFKQSHTILGTVVVALMGLQPLLGFIHHKQYKKHQTRGVVSYAHIGSGRILLILGIVNGGLGLQLASSSRAWIIAYSVLAGIMTVFYVLAVFFKQWRTKKQSSNTIEGQSQSMTPPMQENNHAKYTHA